MKIWRSLLVLLVVMLGLPAAVFALQVNREGNQQVEQNIQYHIVQTGDIAEVVNATGSVEASQVARLSFTQAGIVESVNIQTGDYVLKGDVLAQLDSTIEQAAYDQAALNVQLAVLRRDDLLTPDESAIRVAEANVQAAWAAYNSVTNAVSPDQIRAAELKYQQAQDALDQANFARTHLPDNQVPQTYQLADAQIGMASFNVEIARLQMDSMRKGNPGAANAAYARALQAERALEQVKAGPTEGQILQVERAIEQAQLQLGQAQERLDGLKLIAPFDGIVSLVGVEVGGITAPGLPALELTDVSTLHVDVQVDEIDVRQVAEGMRAEVRFDALPNVVADGKVERIALAGTNESGIISYTTRLALAALDPRIRTGMTAEVAIVVAERPQVLIVPNVYIRLDREADLAFVNWVSDDGQLSEREVRLGMLGQDSSEVISGLADGDVIAIDLSSDRIAFLGG